MGSLHGLPGSILGDHMDICRSLGPFLLKPQGRGSCITLHGIRITHRAAFCGIKA